MPSLSESDRDPRLFVEDMLDFCEHAMAFSAGISREALLQDRMRYDAILRNIELLGEAASRLDQAQRALAPLVPWREIVGTRNRLAHGYLGVSPDTVWDILRVELPALRPLLFDMLSRMPAASA